MRQALYMPRVALRDGTCGPVVVGVIVVVVGDPVHEHTHVGRVHGVERVLPPPQRRCRGGQRLHHTRVLLPCPHDRLAGPTLVGSAVVT
jgi:hypothetical protein